MDHHQPEETEAKANPLVALDCLDALSFSFSRSHDEQEQLQEEEEEKPPNLMDISDNSTATRTSSNSLSSQNTTVAVTPESTQNSTPDSGSIGANSSCSLGDGEETNPTATSSSNGSEEVDFLADEEEEAADKPCFQGLRYTYLAVILVIYLADGLQGTHLYKLYDDYGFSVAWLYCLGFCTGGVLSPVTGPWVDQIGRKRAAMIYCILEILINSLEQYPNYWCVIASRMIGGFTINLLQCVFETWLDSEFRKKGREEEAKLNRNMMRTSQDKEALQKYVAHEYELLMRDAVIVSNAAAIGSGYLSHVLSEWSGPVGPFRGAVVCTMAALVVVASMWTENYGGKLDHEHQQVGQTNTDEDTQESSVSIMEFLRQAAIAFMDDMRMLRVGIVQGLSQGVLYIFVFFWSPVLMDLAKEVPQELKDSTWGLDKRGEPAFGLIFMVFMGACVIGGVIAPTLRQAATKLLTPIVNHSASHDKVPREVSEGSVRPMAVEFLAATCYFVAALMLLVPCLVSGPLAFSRTLYAFCIYEIMTGIVSPCEGVIRSIYFPAHARASVCTLPSLVVNAAVSLAVVCTEYMSLLTVCLIVVGLMMVASVLQISLITATEWVTLRQHVLNSPRYARSVSFQVYETAKDRPRKLIRFLSDRLSFSGVDENVADSIKQAREELEKEKLE